jgi:hypothetical protein
MLLRELRREFTGDNPGGAEAKPPQDKVSYNRCQSNPADSSSSCINDSTQSA